MTTVAPPRRQNLIEQVITALVNGVVVPITGIIPTLVSSGILFLLFGALWLAFGVGLVWSQGSLDAAWEWLRGLPLVIQGVAWLLFLPLTLGLWIWETTWPFVLRLVLVIGLAGWSLFVFIPHRAADRGPDPGIR